jgi:hypothetical protein
VVVDKGDQIGFAAPALDHDIGSVHHIRLPDVVWQFGLEFAPVHRRGCGRGHQAVAGKKAPDAGWRQAGAGGEQLAPVHGLDHRGHGGLGHLLAQLHQIGSGLRVDTPRLTAVASVPRIEGLEFLAAGLVARDPVAHGAFADAAAMGKGDGPFSGALLRQQPLALRPGQPGAGDKIGDDPEAEDGNLLFLLFVHGKAPFGRVCPAIDQQDRPVTGTVRWAGSPAAGAAN